MIWNILLQTILTLVSAVIYPIDLLIEQNIPLLSDALTAIYSFIDVTFSMIGWAISATGIPAITILLLVSYYIFVFTVPYLVLVIKLAVRWYNYLKP